MNNYKEIKNNAIGRVSATKCSTTNRKFVGSEVDHNSFINLTIESAVIDRGTTKDRISPTNRIISVNLTRMQWANLLCNMNGEGSPCTIEFTEKLGYVKYTPLDSGLNHIVKTASEKIKYNHAKNELTLLKELIGNSKLSKRDKNEINIKLNGLLKSVEDSTNFYLKEFQKRTNEIVLDAKNNMVATKATIIESLGKVKLDELNKLE